jgi:hypothetical protein
VFVRTDIPLGYQIVQANHACFEMGLQVESKPNQVSHMVLCAIESEKELEKLSYHLEKYSIKHYMFHEPDYDTGHTAICTEPIYGEQRKLFRKFNLWK